MTDEPTNETPPPEGAQAPAEAEATPAASGTTSPTPSPAGSSRPQRTVAVPMWLLAAFAALLLAISGFAIGYAVGDDDGTDTARPPALNVPDDLGRRLEDLRERFEERFGERRPQAPGGPNAPQGPNQPGPNRTSAAFLGVATEQAGGVRITQVVPGSAADDAGLEVGDVITEFDGHDISTPADLARAVAAKSPGDRVQLTYTRGGTSTTVTVTLGTRGQVNS